MFNTHCLVLDSVSCTTNKVSGVRKMQLTVELLSGPTAETGKGACIARVRVAAPTRVSVLAIREQTLMGNLNYSMLHEYLP